MMHPRYDRTEQAEFDLAKQLRIAARNLHISRNMIERAREREQAVSGIVFAGIIVAAGVVLGLVAALLMRLG